MADSMMQAQHEAAPATPAAPPPYRFVIESMMFLIYAVFGLSWIAVTPLMAELQKELHVSSAALGMLNTAVSIAKVVAPLATGFVAVRVGPRRALLIGAAGIAAAAVAVALAPSYMWFIAGRFAFGLGGAMVVTLLVPIAMQWFPASELPIVIAFNNVAVNTGIAITLLTTIPLANRLGWRGALLCYAGLSIALCAAWAVFARDRPVTQSPSHPQAAGPVSPTSTIGYADVWRMRNTWIIALAFTTPLALYLAFNTWLPRYYVEALGFDRSRASHYTALFNWVGIPSAIAGGVLTRRLGVRRPFLIGAGLCIGFAAFGMIYLRGDLMIASAVVLGISLFIASSPLFTTAMELPGVTPAHISLMMGTVFSFAYLVSSTSPLLVGWLRDRTGSFLPGLSFWAGFSGLLVVCGLLLPETGPGLRKQSR